MVLLACSAYIGFSSLSQLEECLLLWKLRCDLCVQRFRLRKVPWARWLAIIGKSHADGTNEEEWLSRKVDDSNILFSNSFNFSSVFNERLLAFDKEANIFCRKLYFLISLDEKKIFKFNFSSDFSVNPRFKSLYLRNYYFFNQSTFFQL